jgi:heme/copper-type cytochrome/quinol oxidase subunit 2
METNDSPLFSLTIDPVTKSHLTETARWAKFLAITGMVFLCLLIVFGILGSSFFFTRMQGMESTGANFTSYASMIFGAYTIIIAVIWFFPLLFSLRFANQMKQALAGNDQEALNSSFQNLKKTIRYIGIVTIVGLSIYSIVIVVAIMSIGLGS